MSDDLTTEEQITRDTSALAMGPPRVLIRTVHEPVPLPTGEDAPETNSTGR